MYKILLYDYHGNVQSYITKNMATMYTNYVTGFMGYTFFPSKLGGLYFSIVVLRESAILFILHNIDMFF